jgi:DNA repair ATPase RecN
MKKWVMYILVSMAGLVARPQSDEVQQLLLNWEKLSQFRKILKNMYDGYKILDKGYSTIKNISEGNFSLHKTFLDGLLEVSPAVKKYRRISDIISRQVQLVKEGRNAMNRLRDSKVFTPEELEHMTKVYSGIFQRSLKNLEELLMVITSGSLRMNDAERLAAIDRIYSEIEDQFSFLRDYRSRNLVHSLQRTAEAAEVDLSKRLNGLRR